MMFGKLRKGFEPHSYRGLWQMRKFNHIPSDGKLAIIDNLTNLMKHIVKILSLLVAISAFWIGLSQASIVPRSRTWLLPLYFIVSLGCYGLLMVGVGLMQFPTCPQEALLLQQDIVEAKEFLKHRGVDVGSD